MLIYNNRNYPYPVLGVNEDINGEFQVHLSVDADKDYIKVKPTFLLNNNTLKNIIDGKKALFATQVYCRATMFRTMFKSESSKPDPILIETPKLREEVELHFFICANKKIVTYKNDDFHEDYQGFSFDIDRGDILGYGGKGTFNASKAPEELRAVSSFMNIDKHNHNHNYAYNNYDSAKITILLSEKDYHAYQEIAANPSTTDILHSSVVLPALIEAIHEIELGKDDYSENAWFKILKSLIEETKETNLLKIAQKILDNPINRSFSTIKRIINIED
jgi:hypothetical protein